MKTQIIAAAAVLCALAAPAFAAPAAGDQVQVTVSYADLNIATPAGHAALAARVKAAATSICGQRPESLQDLAANAQFNSCVTKIVTQAMAKVPSSAMMAGAVRPNG